MHYLLLAVVVACVIGSFKPIISGSRRRHYVIGGTASFILLVATQPPAPAETPPAKANGGDAQSTIRKKAKDAISHVEAYTPSQDRDVYNALGPQLFSRVAALEPGAIYAAAESNKCDSVEASAVITRKSSKSGVVWYADCKNGNRFVVTQTQAQAALERATDMKLAANDLEESCTSETLPMCMASDAQKAAQNHEAEIVSACDMAVKSALVGDSSMDWTWNVGIGKDDDLKIARGFKAVNAFGANLKHRYFCTYDSGRHGIKELTIEGPLGSQRII